MELNLTVLKNLDLNKYCLSLSSLSDPLENLGFGNLVDQLYKKVARPHLVNPVFLTEHPISLSPLARANDDNPEITDRFQCSRNNFFYCSPSF